METLARTNDMPAYLLFILACQRLPNFFEYEPELVEKELGIGRKDCEKIFASQLVFESSVPFSDWHVFEKVVLVFNDRTVDFMWIQDLTVAEIVWAYHLMRRIDPHSKFSAEVLAFIANQMHEEGFIDVPDSALDKEKSFRDGLSVKWFLDSRNNNHQVFDQEEATRKQLCVTSYVEARKDQENNMRKELTNG